MPVSGGAAGYAGLRVDGAFLLAANTPASEPFQIARAEKGDMLPVGCAGPFEADVAAECMDAAYEIESEPGAVVETRFGATSILSRMGSYTVAAQ